MLMITLYAEQKKKEKSYFFLMNLYVLMLFNFIWSTGVQKYLIHLIDSK